MRLTSSACTQIFFGEDLSIHAWVGHKLKSDTHRYHQIPSNMTMPARSAKLAPFGSQELEQRREKRKEAEANRQARDVHTEHQEWSFVIGLI